MTPRYTCPRVSKEEEKVGHELSVEWEERINENFDSRDNIYSFI